MRITIVPISTVMTIYAFLLILDILGVLGLGSNIVPFLVQYFIQIVVVLFGLIILACLIVIVYVGIKDKSICNRIFFSINLLVSAIISFPMFYMFFLELCCSYSMEGIISTILALVESVVGIVIAAVIFCGYLFVLGSINNYIRYLEGWENIVCYIILTPINIAIVYLVYRLCLHLLVKYYIDDEALELYQNLFSPQVYNFMCFCQNLNERIN